MTLTIPYVKDGDMSFIGMDSRLTPTSLAEGMVQRSENMRMDQGVARTRKGVARMVPTGTIWPTDIFGSGLFVDQSGNAEKIVLVLGNQLKIFNCADQSFADVDFPDTMVDRTVEDDDSPTVVQANDIVFVTRGLNKGVLTWNGGESVVEEAYVPHCTTLLFAQDRLFAADSRDSVNVSGYLDFLEQASWSQLEQFRVLQGGGDYVVALHPWQQDKTLVFGRRSVYVGYLKNTFSTTLGTPPTISADSYLHLITNQLGCLGPRAVVSAGQYVFFLSDSGIMLLTPQLDLELVGDTEPLSAPISDYIERINKVHSDKACGAFYQNRVYFAVPLDDDPSTVASIASTPGESVLPFDLPATLGASAVVTTDEEHELLDGDFVEVYGAVEAKYNGVFEVFNTGNSGATLSSKVFTIRLPESGATDNSDNILFRKISQRNNAVLVYNLVNKAWESVDILPRGVWVDNWILATRNRDKRLWFVSKEMGPCLYEELEVDEVDQEILGLKLPFTLTATLTNSAYARQNVLGRLTTRRYMFGSTEEKRYSSVTAILDMPENGVIKIGVNVVDPDQTATLETVSRSDYGTENVTRKVRVGRRGTAVEVDLQTVSRRPAIRGILVDATATGKRLTNVE